MKKQKREDDCESIDEKLLRSLMRSHKSIDHSILKENETTKEQSHNVNPTLIEIDMNEVIKLQAESRKGRGNVVG